MIRDFQTTLILFCVILFCIISFLVGCGNQQYRDNTDWTKITDYINQQERK